jgi:hypothetical protein
LLDYLPVDKEFQEDIMRQKRDEYSALVQHFFGDFTAATVQNMLKEAKKKTADQDAPALSNFNEFERKNFKQIKIDVQRTQPTLEAFRAPQVQAMMIRVLFIWAVQHKTIGYV